jgi:NADP-dependent 3-hydroxy acid dehydrogenase YdfG
MERKDYHPDRLLQPEDISAMVLCALALPDTAEVTDLHIRPLKKSP